jgi:PIN like domain
VIFVDRSIPRGVAQALQRVRNDVRWLEDCLPHNATDSDWLQLVGASGWLAITRDKKIRTRPGERADLVRYGVGCFILTQKQPLTRWDYLRLIVSTLDQMEANFAETARPFIYGVNRSGGFKRIH